MLSGLPKTLAGVLCLCGLLAAAGPPGIWLDVPFVKQKKNGCGAASISMVMQYWLRQQGGPPDKNADAESIQRALYTSQAKGIYASALERYLQNHGFRTFAFRGEWGDLRDHLEKGRPLIVALKPAGGVPVHYVVVTGLDWERTMVLVNDPARRKLLKQDRFDFEKQWNAAGNWTLLAVPQQGV
jgi:ABC-type bacteriocin/lantibiotic exporter with double-glycine peptidase domain